MNDTELLQKIPSNMEDWKGFVSTTATITTIVNFLTGLQVSKRKISILPVIFLKLSIHTYPQNRGNIKRSYFSLPFYQIF